MSDPRRTSSPRWRVLLLAALAALAALLLPAATASAATPSAAETRVGAIGPAVTTIVGIHECITAGQRPVRGLSQPQIALSNCVAAEGESGLATAARSCLNSFTGDTPVLMADGKEEPIAAVKVGDKVLAIDPETGRTGGRPVTALIRHSGEHTMVDLTLSDGSKITTTDHHPFWDASTRTFTDAINLHVGEKLLRASRQALTITGERVYDQDLTAYNLQIDGIHTYYAGTTAVLVHNSCESGLDATGKVHGDLPTHVPSVL